MNLRLQRIRQHESSRQLLERVERDLADKLERTMSKHNNRETLKRRAPRKPKAPTRHWRLHPTLDFLYMCDACGRHHDVECFENVGDLECAAQKRKRKRIKEGLFLPGAARASGNKAAHRRKKVTREAAEKAFKDWKTSRKKQLADLGVPPWHHYSRLSKEAPAVRERLGLEPLGEPQVDGKQREEIRRKNEALLAQLRSK